MNGGLERGRLERENILRVLSELRENISRESGAGERGVERTGRGPRIDGRGMRNVGEIARVSLHLQD